MDPDRRAAEYIISVGGSVVLVEDGKTYTAAAELPKTPFRVREVMLTSSQRVTDAGLAAFNDCKNLSSLDLGGTNVTDAGLAHVKNLGGLTELLLAGTKVSDAGLAHLKDLKGLNSLSLLQTAVTAKGLEALHTALPKCQITHDGGVIGPPVDPDRRAAEYVLSVGGTVRVNDAERQITAAADLPAAAFRLTSCVLIGGQQLTDTGLASFKDCKNLNYLNLNNTKATDAGLAHFKDCRNLAYVFIAATQVTDAGLAHFKNCKNLRGLNLDETAVTDESAKVIQEFTFLKGLNIIKAKMSPEGVQKLAAKMPGCEINHDGGVIEPTAVADPDRKATEYVLSVGGSVVVNDVGGHKKALAELPKPPYKLTVCGLVGNQKITPEGMANFSGCKHIRYLHLDRSAVTDAGLAHFKDCKDLTSLELPGTPVTDAGLAHFKDFTKVTFLTVGACKIGDAGLANFKACKGLTVLAVSDTAVGDASIPVIQGFPALTILYANKTNLTPAGVKQLAAKLPTCKIEHDGGVIMPKK